MAKTGEGAVAETIDHSLTEKLMDEQTAEQLLYLLDKLENVSFLIDMIENFLRRGPEIIDSINDLVIFLRQDLMNSEYMKMFESASKALQRIQQFYDSPQVQELFKSDVLDLRAVQIVGKAARSLVQASEGTVETRTKRVGLIGLMRLMTDPEIQPAINFFISFARQFSKELEHARTVDRV